MRLGVPKEIKTDEHRVGLTPAAVRELARHGHSVLVERGAGIGAGLDDAAYEQAGARLVADADAVFAGAEMIVKVKEPQPEECRRLRPGQILFTYLHLAPDPEQTRLLLASGATAIAYETVTDAAGRLPLLAPMSEVAGRMSVQAAAHALARFIDGDAVDDRIRTGEIDVFEGAGPRGRRSHAVPGRTHPGAAPSGRGRFPSSCVRR